MKNIQGLKVFLPFYAWSYIRRCRIRAVEERQLHRFFYHTGLVNHTFKITKANPKSK